MGTPRVYVDLPLDAGCRILLPAGATQHLLGVLRLAVGAPLVLFNGDGHDYSARLLDRDRRGARALIEGAGAPEPQPVLRLRLGLGVSKAERFDFALQKAVELGVTEIQPLFTERSVVRLDGERLARRGAHWSGILIAACEQSGRRRLPHLAVALRLVDWLAQPQPGGLLLDPRAEQSLTERPAPTAAATLLVGPEGGLSARERDAARQCGFVPVRLGPRILRTETAPLAALAAIQTLWGDFR